LSADKVKKKKKGLFKKQRTAKKSANAGRLGLERDNSAISYKLGSEINLRANNE